MAAQVGAAVLTGAAVVLTAEKPALPVQAMVGALGVLLLALAAGAWRRSAFVGAACGVAVAAACAASARSTWLTPDFAEIPKIAIPAVALAIVLLLWGLIARAGVVDAARLGMAGLLAGVALTVFGLLSALLLNHPPAPIPRYAVETYQVQELLAAVLLYPAALWTGSAGVRPDNRWTPLPLLLGLLLVGAVVAWNR
jgi:hypothetical protein